MLGAVFLVTSLCAPRPASAAPPPVPPNHVFQRTLASICNFSPLAFYGNAALIPPTFFAFSADGEVPPVVFDEGPELAKFCAQAISPSTDFSFTSEAQCFSVSFDAGISSPPSFYVFRFSCGVSFQFRDPTFGNIVRRTQGVTYDLVAFPTPCATGTRWVGPGFNDCAPIGPPLAELQKDKNNGPPQQECTGNPCDPATGNKYQSENDLRAGESSLTLSRSYNSQLNANLGFGFGWTSTLSSKRLELLNATTIQIRQGSGRGEPFTKNSAGLWHGDADTQLVLTQDASGFTLSNRNGLSERYDTTGKLLSDTDANGQTASFGYDTNGRVATVTGPFGHSLSFAYSATGNVSTVTDPTGAVYAYSYDANNNLIRVNYPDASSKLYHYEDTRFPHHLTGISYDDGAGTVTRFATFAYDATGKAVLTEHAITENTTAQERFTLAYDTDTQTTVTDPVGVQERLSFATQLGVKNLVTKLNLGDNQTLTQSFDANNNLTCKQDEAGRVTTYTYNATNQRTSMTEGQSGDCIAPVTTAATRTTSFQYLSPTLSLPTVITAPSVVVGQIKTATMAYTDPVHPTLPTEITQSGFSPEGISVSRTVSMSYNAAGQVNSIDGPRTDVSDVTTLAYNECSTGTSCGQLASTTNALGQTTIYNSYDANGRLTQLTDPNGTTTGFSYDPRGRVIGVTVTPPVGQGSARLTQSSYDHIGQLTQAILPDGVTLSYTYDAAQYLRSITDNLGNKIEYGYDLKGNRIREQTFDPDATLVRSLEQAYDLRNRISQINAAGSLTQQLRDAVGNLVQVTDPNQSASATPLSTTHDYDALNRLLQTVDNLSGITAYTYDANDRLKQVSAPNSAATQYSYDDLGNLLSETSPDRGALTYTHDEAGNVLTTTDARDITATYTYDQLNRVTSITYPNPAEHITLHYDTGTNCAFGIGRLCQVSDETGVTQYAYDAFGNTTEQRKTELNITYTTRYAYDAGDRITQMTYPDGRTVTYTRDAIGRISAVTTLVNGIAQDVVANRAYRADGLLTAQTFANGLTETRSYDLQGRLIQQALGSLDTRTYGYDANGNRLTLTREGTLAQTTDYDALDRLTQETQPVGGYTLTYDPNGNRTAVALGPISAALDYAPNTNRLVNLSGTDPRTGINLSAALNYDAAGNLTTLAGLGLLSYNNAGRLNRIGAGFLTLARYAYNFQGQRTQKTTPLGRTIYHYDLQGNLISETNATGQTLKAYVWAEDQPVAQIAATGTPVYLHTDHLNTPRLATNPAGTIIWSWNSDAFGAISPDSDPDADGTRTTINLRFPGQYFDAETGLFYNWNRYYDPRLGRYITSDPIGLGGGLNSYAYVGNNPLAGVDPLGLIEWSGTLGLVFANVTSPRLPFGGGGFKAKIFLKSKCHNGQIWSVEIDADGWGWAFGKSVFKRVSGGATGVSVEDGLTWVDPYVFNGRFSLGATSLPFYTPISVIKIGSAQGNIDGFGFGTDVFGGIVLTGRAKVTNAYPTDCSNCEK